MNEDIVEKAIRFATKSHGGQVRKGSQKPYIIHPLEVGNIVSTVTKDKEIIAAAILHDTIKNCEGITKEVIRESFGDRVDKTKTWDERKTAYDRTFKDSSI